jgi:hypothetical protein
MFFFANKTLAVLTSTPALNIRGVFGGGPLKSSLVPFTKHFLTYPDRITILSRFHHDIENFEPAFRTPSR